MSVLFSGRAVSEVRDMLNSGDSDYKSLINFLQNVDQDKFDLSSVDVRKLEGLEEDIYIKKVRSLRIFFINKENDVFIISVAKRSDYPSAIDRIRGLDKF